MLRTVNIDGQDVQFDTDAVDIHSDWILNNNWAKDLGAFVGSATVDAEGILVIKLPFGNRDNYPAPPAIANLAQISNSFKKHIISFYIAGYEVKDISPEGFKVGCQTVTWDQVNALLKLKP